MTGTLALFSLMVFGGVAVATYALLDIVFSEDRRVSRRLKGLTEYETVQAKEAEPMLRSFAERIVRPAIERLTEVAKSLWPKNYTGSLNRRLERAGYPRGLRIERLIAAKLLFGLGSLGLLVGLALLGSWGFGWAVFITVSVSIFSFFIPDMWVDSQASRRQNQIVRQLPDMLDLLTISVEAGLGFDAALTRIVRRSTGALPEEFGRVLQEVQAGSSRKEALRAFAERVNVSEISAFITSLIQADVFGVSIAQVLRTQANEMRLVRRQRAEERAQKAPVKMVFPILLCVLPATIIVILGPAVIRISGLFGY